MDAKRLRKLFSDWLDRLSPTFRRSWQFTFSGMVFAAITAFVFLAAINSQANLLFFAFGLMVAAIVVSAAFSTLMLAKIDVTREIPDHAEVAQQVELRYRLASRNRFWPCFAIHVTEHAARGAFAKSPRAYLLHLSARQSTSIAANLVPAQRGELQLDRIRLTCSFPFGLVRRVIHIHQPMTIVVYPRIGALNHPIVLRSRDINAGGSATSHAKGGNDEFYALREYRAGDNTRAIHWRRTARTGQIMIREMTQSSPPHMIVIIDLRRWRNTPRGSHLADSALELAATIVCHAMVENYAIGLFIPGVPAAVGLLDPRTGRDQRDRLLRAIGLLNINTITHHAQFPPVSTAHYVVITLRADDLAADIVPVNASVTRLSLDHPDSAEWVRYPQSAAETTAAAAPV